MSPISLSYQTHASRLLSKLPTNYAMFTLVIKWSTLIVSRGMAALPLTRLIPGVKMRSLSPYFTCLKNSYDTVTLLRLPTQLRLPAIPSTTETPTLTRPRHCYNAHQRPPSPPRLHTAYHHRQPSPIRNSAAHNHTDHKRCSGNHILLRHNNKPITSNYLRYASQNACYPSLCLYADAVNHTLLPLF